MKRNNILLIRFRSRQRKNRKLSLKNQSQPIKGNSHPAQYRAWFKAIVGNYFFSVVLVDFLVAEAGTLGVSGALLVVMAGTLGGIGALVFAAGLAAAGIVSLGAVVCLASHRCASLSYLEQKACGLCSITGSE